MRSLQFRLRTLMTAVAVSAIIFAGIVTYPGLILAVIVVAAPCVFWAFVLGQLGKAMGINTYWTKVLIIFASSATIAFGARLFLPGPSL